MNHKGPYMRKNITIGTTLRRISLILFCLLPLKGICQTGEATVDALVKMGFENVGWTEDTEERVFVIQNSAYRLEGVGIGKAVDLIQKMGLPENKPCRLIVLDNNIPHLHLGSDSCEGPACKLQKNTMLVLAVTLHNIPEGMAVGVVFAGMLEGGGDITAAAALTLSLGIAIQNFPEGAIISMPLKSENNMRKGKSFLYGVASGAVEPAAAGLTLLLTHFVVPVLPYILAFAAGAMLYVVVEELIPEASEGKHSNVATLGFAVGFAVMMTLDVALG